MVDMWNCACCGKVLTTYDEIENEVDIETHFDIERSHKELDVENDTIEEALECRNVKMNRMVCENCFNIILTESKTLRKTFECRIDGKIEIIF